MKNLLIITQKVDRDDPVLGFFHAWIKEFSKYFEKLYVICLEKGSHDLPQNVEVFSLGKEIGGNKVTYFFNFFYYLFSLHKKYDNVFVHMNQVYILLAGLWWKITGKKIGLWYAHGSVTSSLSFAEKLSDAIFTSTKAGFKLPSKKLKIVGQGIDTEFFKPKEIKNNNDILKLITVGRISEIKDYVTIIRAMELLKKRGTEFILNIVGSPITENDKIYLNKIKALVVDLELSSNISFIGAKKQDDILTLLWEADLFVNASRNKSLDKAIVEAMSVGLPVVSCNESFGLIYNDEDLRFSEGDQDGMSRAIENYYKLSLEHKKILSTKMRSTVEGGHSLKRLIRELASFYE